MIYVTVNYRIIPYLNALCCVVSSNPFKPRTRLARDQSKSDSPDLSAPVARCSVTALNCFLRLFHERRRSINDARPVAPHYSFSRLRNFLRSLFLPTSPSLLALSRYHCRTTISSSDWPFYPSGNSTRPTFLDDGATTRNDCRFALRVSEEGREVLHFYEILRPHPTVHNTPTTRAFYVLFAVPVVLQRQFIRKVFFTFRRPFSRTHRL